MADEDEIWQRIKAIKARLRPRVSDGDFIKLMAFGSRYASNRRLSSDFHYASTELSPGRIKARIDEMLQLYADNSGSVGAPEITALMASVAKHQGIPKGKTISWPVYDSFDFESFEPTPKPLLEQWKDDRQEKRIVALAESTMDKINARSRKCAEKNQTRNPSSRRSTSS